MCALESPADRALCYNPHTHISAEVCFKLKSDCSCLHMETGRETSILNKGELKIAAKKRAFITVQEWIKVGIPPEKFQCECYSYKKYFSSL